MRTSKIVLSVLFVLSILITACGAGTSATQAPAAGSEPVTLRVLVHQNPPMVDFMNTFNAKFQEKISKHYYRYGCC